MRIASELSTISLHGTEDSVQLKSSENFPFFSLKVNFPFFLSRALILLVHVCACMCPGSMNGRDITMVVALTVSLSLVMSSDGLRVGGKRSFKL